MFFRRRQNKDFVRSHFISQSLQERAPPKYYNSNLLDSTALSSSPFTEATKFCSPPPPPPPLFRTYTRQEISANISTLSLPYRKRAAEAEDTHTHWTPPLRPLSRARTHSFFYGVTGGFLFPTRMASLLGVIAQSPLVLLSSSSSPVRCPSRGFYEIPSLPSQPLYSYSIVVVVAAASIGCFLLVRIILIRARMGMRNFSFY